MKRRLYLFSIILALLGVFLILGQAAAQQSTPPAATPNTAAISDDQVNAVAHELYCPVCENIPLDVCPTQACAQWRELIRQKLALGQTKDQIKAYFAAQYGDRVLSEPPTSGLNLLVYILPVVFFLVGVYLVVRVLRGRKPAPAMASTPAQAPAAPENTDPYIQRLEEELKKRK